MFGFNVHLAQVDVLRASAGLLYAAGLSHDYNIYMYIYIYIVDKTTTIYASKMHIGEQQTVLNTRV